MIWWLNKIFGIGKLNIDLSYVASGNLIASVAGVLFWLVLAAILTTEDYGRLNYYIAIASVLSAASLMGLATTVTAYVARGNEKIQYQANLLVLVSNSIVFLLLLLFMKYIPVSILLIGLSFFAMSVAEHLGRKLYRKYFFLVVTERVSQIALSVLLYLLIGLDGLLIGYGLAALVFSYRFFKTFSKFSFSVSELRQKFSFTKYVYPMKVSEALNIHVDKLIIAPLFGFHILGLYQLGFQALMFLTVIPTSLFEYLLPQESSGVERKKVRLGAFITSIIFAIIFSAISPLVIRGLFPNYVEAIEATQIMIFAIIPMTVNSIIRARLLGMERSKPVFVGAMIYLGTLPPMLYLLGGTFGLIGLAISVVISLTIQSLYLWGMNSVVNRTMRGPDGSGKTDDSQHT